MNTSTKKVDTPLVAKEKPKKRSLVERELETTLSPQFVSPITNDDSDSISRYGRARRHKTDIDFCDTVKAVTKVMQSPALTKLPAKSLPAYKMHASNSQVTESPNTSKIENNLENQIENIYNANISLSRFSSEEKKKSPSTARKMSKVYIRKDLIQTKEKEEPVTMIKNMFSPAKSTKKSNSHLNNVLERSSEKYNIQMDIPKRQNGYLDTSSVVKTLDFDSKKKNKSKEKEDSKTTLPKSDIFEMEAKCAYQVGDIAWARMGTYPFWPCIVTREPGSDMFVKKKLYGKIERDIIHVTFFADNGRRSWIADTMLRRFQGLHEFETVRDQFTSETKKKDPRLYAAFFISDKKLVLWHTAIEEADILLREPKRLRIDILNDLLTSQTIKYTPSKIPKGGKITRTDSDVSLSESLFDSLFSEDDGSLLTPQKQRKKSLDVSDVVTACLDNMAAKTGMTKIQRQSHMDIWLQKAKSKTPEKSQFNISVTVERVEKDNKEDSKKDKDSNSSDSAKKKRWVPPREPLHKPYGFRKSTESQHLFHLQNEHDYSKSISSQFKYNEDINEQTHVEKLHEDFTQSDNSICTIEKIESLRTENDIANNIITTEVHDDFIERVENGHEVINKVDSMDTVVEQDNSHQTKRAKENRQDVVNESSKLEFEKSLSSSTPAKENRSINGQNNIPNVDSEKERNPTEEKISPPKKRILRSHRTFTPKETSKLKVTPIKLKLCKTDIENKNLEEFATESNIIEVTDNLTQDVPIDIDVESANMDVDFDISYTNKIKQNLISQDKNVHVEVPKKSTITCVEVRHTTENDAYALDGNLENDTNLSENTDEQNLPTSTQKKRILRSQKTLSSQEPIKPKVLKLQSREKIVTQPKNVDINIDQDGLCVNKEFEINLIGEHKPSKTDSIGKHSKKNCEIYKKQGEATCTENQSPGNQNHMIITNNIPKQEDLPPSLRKKRLLRIHKTLPPKETLKLQVTPKSCVNNDNEIEDTNTNQVDNMSEIKNENNIAPDCKSVEVHDIDISNTETDYSQTSTEQEQNMKAQEKYIKEKTVTVDINYKKGSVAVKTPVDKQCSKNQNEDTKKTLDENNKKDEMYPSTPRKRNICIRKISAKDHSEPKAVPVKSKSCVININKFCKSNDQNVSLGCKDVENVTMQGHDNLIEEVEKNHEVINLDQKVVQNQAKVDNFSESKVDGNITTYLQKVHNMDNSYTEINKCTGREQNIKVQKDIVKEKNAVDKHSKKEFLAEKTSDDKESSEKKLKFTVKTDENNTKDKMCNSTPKKRIIRLHNISSQKHLKPKAVPVKSKSHIININNFFKSDDKNESLGAKHVGNITTEDHDGLLGRVQKSHNLVNVDQKVVQSQAKVEQSMQNQLEDVINKTDIGNEPPNNDFSSEKAQVILVSTDKIQSTQEQCNVISKKYDLHTSPPKKRILRLRKTVSPKELLKINVSPVKSKFSVIDIDKCISKEVEKNMEQPVNKEVLIETMNKDIEKTETVKEVIEEQKQNIDMSEEYVDKQCEQMNDNVTSDVTDADLNMSFDDDQTSCSSNQVSESLIKNSIIEQNEIMEITEELAMPVVVTSIENINIVNIANDMNVITDDDMTSCSSRQITESIRQTPITELDEIMEVTEYLVTPSGVLEEKDSFEKSNELFDSTVTKKMEPKAIEDACIVPIVEKVGEPGITEPIKDNLNENLDVANMPIITVLAVGEIPQIETENDILSTQKNFTSEVIENLESSVERNKNPNVSYISNNATTLCQDMVEIALPNMNKEKSDSPSSSKSVEDMIEMKHSDVPEKNQNETSETEDAYRPFSDTKNVQFPIENSTYDSISLRSEISSLTNYTDNNDKDFDPDNISITSLSSGISNISEFQPRVTRVRSLSVREYGDLSNDIDKPHHTLDSDSESIGSFDDMTLNKTNTSSKKAIPKIIYSSENTMDSIKSDTEKRLRLVLTDCLLERKESKLPKVKKISSKNDSEFEISSTATTESTPRRLSLRAKKPTFSSDIDSFSTGLNSHSPAPDLKSPATASKLELKSPSTCFKTFLESSSSDTLSSETKKKSPISSSSYITPKKSKPTQSKITDIWSISPTAESSSSPKSKTDTKVSPKIVLKRISKDVPVLEESELNCQMSNSDTKVSPNDVFKRISKDVPVLEESVLDSPLSKSDTKVSPKDVLKRVSNDVSVLKDSELKVNGFPNSRPSSPDIQVKEPELDTISIKSTDSNSYVKRKGKKSEYEPKKEPEFLKYLEVKQDALMDEHPELNYEGIIAYLYNTWKVESKTTDEIDCHNLVKGVNHQENAAPKKKKKPLIINIRKIINKETFKKSSTIEDIKPRELPKRKAAKPFYCEDVSDIEEEIEMFEIFKKNMTPKVESKQDDSTEVKTESSTSLNIEQTKHEIKEEIQNVDKEEFEEDYYDEEELYFEQLTKPKPNVFKGMIREKVCEICEKTLNLVKCKGCNGMFHVDCVNKVVEVIETPAPTRGRKKKKKLKVRNPKSSLESNEESPSDEKSHDLNNSEENVSIEELKEAETLVIPDAEDFETKVEAKMKEIMREIIDLTAKEYESYSSDDGIDWTDTVAGKCEIIDVKLKPRSQPVLTDYSDFKCKNCQEHSTPICFVCKSAVSPKTKTDKRQKCQVPHCHKFYHLECLDHWPQTQFNAGELSRNNKKIEDYFEPLTCPRHVCHTCVCDDPRGCKTRFSGDKLARCVRCPATYHSFTKCLPAGSQILSASHIVCPRHYEHRPGKVPYHVNTGWCFICALGGKLICCDYCPTSFHADCLSIEPPEGGYMCEDCETGRLPLYGEMVWVKLGHYRWWPGIILHPSEIPHNILAVKHSPGEFVVRFFGQYDHYWVNRGRVFPFQEGDSGKISTQKSKIDEAFTKAMEHAHRAFEILKNVEPNDEENQDIASSLLPPHYVKLKVNKPCGALYGKKVDLEESSLTPCECNPDEEDPCGPYSHCLNRMLLTECGPTCRAGERCQNRQFEKRQYPKLVPYRTQHRGWGLKTLEEIKAGQFVIEYVGELIDEAEFRRRMRRKHETRDENFYFLTLDKERMIDAGPKGNLARFMNHCCEPNCETQKWTVLGDIRVGLFAIDDIPANTEVTFNYNLECNGIEKKQCMCGAKRCSGYIGAKPKQEEPQPKKPKRTYKKRKNADSPSTSAANKNKPKRPIGRPPKPKEPRELTEIEKDLLIIKNATNGISSDSEGSGRLSSIDLDNDKKESKESKALKRKRVSLSTEDITCNGSSPSVKKIKLDDEKSDAVGD